MEIVRVGLDLPKNEFQVHGVDRDGSLRWLFQSIKQFEHAYGSYRILLGKFLLVGLELLVAADIIRTVTLELTLMILATLALLVLVRTALAGRLRLYQPRVLQRYRA